MEFLFISKHPPYPLKNSQRALIYFLAQQLTANRHNVDLYCFYQQPEDFADIPRYDHLFRTIEMFPQPDKNGRPWQQRIQHLKKGQPFYPEKEEDSLVPDMWHKIKQAQTHPYAVVQFFGGIEIHEWVSLVKHIPGLIVPYHAESRLATDKNTRKIWEVIQQHLYKAFKRVIVLTDKDADILIKLKAHKKEAIQVISGGVDTSYFVPTGHEPDIPALLMIGNFALPHMREAALSLCQKIYPRVSQDFPNLRLYIIGTNPPPELRQMASEKIEICDDVPDFRPYFELASVFVSPLWQGSGHPEHILQAMAMMTPVITTPAGLDGLPLVHNRDALIVHNPTEMANQVIRVLKDSQVRLHLQIAGREKIEQQYSWEQIFDRYFKQYEQII